MNRIWAVMAAFAVLGAALAPAAEAGVRVRWKDATPAPVELNIPDLPAVDYKGLLNADALTVAIGKTALLPSAQAGAKPLANLVKGTHVKKLGEEGGYYKVETADKKQGYVIRYAMARGKIALKPVAASVLGTVTAKAATEVYLFPNKKAPSVGKLSAGQKVAHLNTMGGFFKVKTPQGKVGWVDQAAGTATAK